MVKIDGKATSGNYLLQDLSKHLHRIISLEISTITFVNNWDILDAVFKVFWKNPKQS